MSSQTQAPSGSATTADGGAVDWSSVASVRAQDGISATANLSNNKSYVITTGTYGFTIPGTATITGIQVTVWKSGGSDISDFLVGIAVPGATGSSNNYAAGGGWPSINSAVGYGGSSDLWGLSGITPTGINDAGFGASVQAQADFMGGTAAVDFIGITVYYTVPTIGPGGPRIIGRPLTVRRNPRDSILARPPWTPTIAANPLPRQVIVPVDHAFYLRD